MAFKEFLTRIRAAAAAGESDAALGNYDQGNAQKSVLRLKAMILSGAATARGIKAAASRKAKCRNAKQGDQRVLIEARRHIKSYSRFPLS